ncbi:MAG: hypothetical protein OXC38_09005 [Gammaproteobacteria bacterium]|nr:hypothetical protein [Gammaproteobacteria bacterium]
MRRATRALHRHGRPTVQRRGPVRPDSEHEQERLGPLHRGEGADAGGARGLGLRGVGASATARLDPGFKVSLDAIRKEPANDSAAEHGVMLRSLVRWQGAGQSTGSVSASPRTGRCRVRRRPA